MKQRTCGGFLGCLAAALLLASAGAGSLSAWEGEGFSSGEVPRFLLLRVELPQGFYAAERAALESDFVNALLATRAVQVVSRTDTQEIVNELKFQATDLVDQDRASALGRLMGASHLVTVSVQPLHGQFQVTARRVNVETAEVDRVVVRRSESRVDFLPALLTDMAYDLAGAERQKGTVRIQSEPRSAQVLLFGVPAGESPVTVELAPGAYLFTVRKAGYADRRKTVQVVSGQETPWTAQLSKRETRRLRDYIEGKSIWGRD